MSEEEITSLIRTAEILTVGTELLMGQITNTNAAFLGAELRNLGINTYYQTVVGDNYRRMREALETAVRRSDAVIITGGLGPTPDDICMQVASDVCGLSLSLNEDAAKTIERYYTDRGRKMALANLKQAMLPESAIVLPNSNGTAPGAIFSYREDGHICRLILLPGPPNENRLMFREQVRPFLERFTEFELSNTFIHLIDIGESDTMDLLGDLLADEQVNPSLAPYALNGEVCYRLTYRHQKGSSAAPAKAMLDEVCRRLAPYIYEIGERSLAEVTGQKLISAGKTVAFAESCTAGMLASALAAVPGISAVLKGGLVTYQLEMKEKLLQVPAELLAEEGAVSEKTALVMARNARKIFGSDYAVSVTGNAGPEPSEGKPVGLVYIAVSDEAGEVCKTFRFGGNRQKIRELTAKQGLNLLRKRLDGLI